MQISVLKELSEPSQTENEHDLNHTLISITKAINKLTPKSKEIFQLSKVEGLNNHEISDKLGLSCRTIENQLSLALKKVKEDIKST